MRTAQLRAFFLAAAALSLWTATAGQGGPPHVAIAIHGGAGTILKADMTPEKEAAYRSKLAEAVAKGYELLKEGRSSVDAVEASIEVLEDSPLFNAGKGAVFTSAGTNELDAAVMDGATLKAGAVASVRHVKNPISLARLVMEKSPHVLLVGEGAEAFAKRCGMKLVSRSYFYTEHRWQQLQDAKKQAKDAEKQPAQHSPRVHGTVGCVALDGAGHLAAGTSTGGLTNKWPGRVGDTPIIGAGTYADDATCAVSATGQGEYFMRGVVAHDVSALMAYKGLPVAQAARSVIHDKLSKLGGTGGLIAMDARGNVAVSFNTEGMFRATTDGDGKPVVEMYGENGP